MARSHSLTTLQVLVLSWLAALAAFPAALLLAGVGQGLGAVLGGCSWIGLCLPLHRQVWAVVNEPTVAFAYSASAAGYWFGALVLPLAVAVLAIPLVPRRRSLAAELTVVQTAWACALLGLAEMPLLDPAEGHLGRWLKLHHQPAALLWLAPAVAAVAALPAAHRLLTVDRDTVGHPSRVRRLAVVVFHLALPAALWLTAVSVAGGSFPRRAAVAMAVPVLAALVLAWAVVPPRLPRRLAPPLAGSWLGLILAAALLWLLTAAAGRPLPHGRNAALLWGRPLATNTIRRWMEPTSLPWPPSARPGS